MSGLLGAVLCGGARAPAGWVEAERPLPVFSGAAPLDPPMAAMAGAIPIAQLAHRPEIIAFLIVVLTSMTATWGAHSLFRGRSRWLAACVAGALSTLTLLHWLHATAFAFAFPGLPAALFGTLAVTALVRSLVHRGRITPPAAARVIAAASVVVLLDVAWGVALLASLGLVIWSRASRRPAQRWSTAIGVALAPASLTAIALTIAGPGLTWPPISAVHIGLPPLHLPEAHLPEPVLYPALALIVLLVIPLRWRGGPALVILTTLSLVVQVDGRPLAPIPALLVLLCIAASGWVWLAGSTWPRHPRRDTLQAVLATMAVGALVAAPAREIGWAAAPTAAKRAAMPIVRLYDDALAKPGDVFLVHDPSLHRLLEERRQCEGWRPDVQIEEAFAIAQSDLLPAMAAWRADRRRVLSDSFDAGGRWPASWVVENAPLFRFVGVDAGDPILETAADSSAVESAWTRLRDDRDRRSLFERRRLVRLAIERARFRRATGDAEGALEVLGLEPVRQQALETRLLLARSVRPHAGVASELPAGVEDRAWLGIRRLSTWSEGGGAEALWTEAALAAEAGDLLYAHGEQQRAVDLLAEAAREGYQPAWGALVRWQLRAGEDAAAHDILEVMASDPDLRIELLEVVQWLLARDRIIDAQAIMASIEEPSHAVARELSTRLRLLRTLGESTPTTFVQRADEHSTLARPPGSRPLRPKRRN